MEPSKAHAASMEKHAANPATALAKTRTARRTSSSSIDLPLTRHANSREFLDKPRPVDHMSLLLMSAHSGAEGVVEAVNPDVLEVGLLVELFGPVDAVAPDAEVGVGAGGDLVLRLVVLVNEEVVENGDGVAKDLARGSALYKKGCDGGSAPGCYNLGINYANGQGVPKDRTRAAALFKKACKLGHKKACKDIQAMNAKKG